MSVSISSAHGLFVPGAKSILNEVAESRKTVHRVAGMLRAAGVPATAFHENKATNARDNVNAIVAWHNSQTRTMDVSVHFNAVAGVRAAGIGTETLYREGNAATRLIASDISAAISNASGLILRRGDGTWGRDGLGFLNRTNIDRAVLLEICFVNSETDAKLYNDNFEKICAAVAWAVAKHSVKSRRAGPAC